MAITRVVTFDSAHHLENYDGPCSQIHGHTYKLEVTVRGPINDQGFVLDFYDLKQLINEAVIIPFDHQYLNKCVPFNPTCENLVLHFWQLLQDKLSPNQGITLEKICLWETAGAAATLTRGDMEN